MLEKVARACTIFTVICLGWLIPGLFAPPMCSKSPGVQSFDIVDSTAQSRVWSCDLDASGKDITPDHRGFIRILENKVLSLQAVIRWYELPEHFFRAKFDLSKSDEEMEIDLITTYLKAQPELASEFQKLLPRLTIATFGHFQQKSGLWNPIARTLQNARVSQQVQTENGLSLRLRLRGLLRPTSEIAEIPVPTLTVAQIDSQLTEVYAHWNSGRKILYVKGPTNHLQQAAPWFGPTLFIQSDEREFSNFLKTSKDKVTLASIRKVLWTPATSKISDALIYLLNDQGSKAFAAKTSSDLPFVEIYFPGLSRQTSLNLNQPLLKQLLVASKVDHEIHQPAFARDLVTLYRWPPSP